MAAGELQPPAKWHADRKAQAGAYVTWEKVHEEITIKDVREANIYAKCFRRQNHMPGCHNIELRH